MVKKETLFLNGSVILLSSPLSASTRGPQYLKAFGFPIKDFGNDGGGITPEWFYEESTVLKSFWIPDKIFQA